MRVVIHKNGMLEMSIINVIFLTNVEKCVIFLVTQLLSSLSILKRLMNLQTGTYVNTLVLAILRGKTQSVLAMVSDTAGEETASYA